MNNELPDCTGCAEGRHGMVTHQMGTKQHPTVAPTNRLQSLKEEANRDFVKYCIEEDNTVPPLLDTLIEKAFTAGKEEEYFVWRQEIEKVLNTHECDNLIEAVMSARTNKSLD